MFTVKQMLVEFWEYNINVYIAFIDFRQAYGSVRREKIPNKLIGLVKVDTGVCKCTTRKGIFK
jgi:hypothetical protein